MFDDRPGPQGRPRVTATGASGRRFASQVMAE